jgi:hypothetical protein
MTNLPSPERALCEKLPKNPRCKPSAQPFSMRPATFSRYPADTAANLVPSAEAGGSARSLPRSSQLIPARGPGVVGIPDIGYALHRCRETGQAGVVQWQNISFPS